MKTRLCDALIRQGLDPNRAAALYPPRGASPGAVLVAHESDAEPVLSVWCRSPKGEYRSTDIWSGAVRPLVMLLGQAAGHC